jgi:hypothetical protein
MSIRVPAELRAQLEAAARRRGRNVSEELLARLNSSFQRERDKAVDPAMRALNFLFSTLAYSVHWNMPNWRSDAFLFKAIKIGIAKLLDALEPGGDADLPDFWRAAATMSPDIIFRPVLEDWMRATQSPEDMADYAVRNTLHSFVSPRPLQNSEALRGLASTPGWEELGGRILRDQEGHFYGMKDAKRDLAITKRSK